MFYPNSLRRQFLFFFCLFSIFPSALFASIGKKAMVATAHPYATEAALAVLQHGGNAVDAAIAAQWVLNVVEPQSSGIGGGGFFLYFDAAKRRIYTFDGRETAPADASPEMFLDNNKEPYPFNIRATGGLPVGVPGILKLLKLMHEKFGSKTFGFAELFEPAIEVAEKGFPVYPKLSSFIDTQKERLRLFESSRKIFLNAQGDALKQGQTLIQKDLAETFRLIQRQGVSVFYEGSLGDEIVNAVHNAPFHPGRMKKQDLFYYKVLERDPVQGNYRGYDIFSMGPPSSGGTTLIETLNILEHFDVKALGHSPDFVHAFSEAQKLAFQNRNQFIADPHFTKIPLQDILSKAAAEKQFEKIKMYATLPVVQDALALEGTTTTQISIVDESGNMVSFTTTIEHIFGSAMIVPGRGFFLNNELTDFDAVPKDEKGKLKANAPQGEKRPRSSMTPTFVFKNGLPALIVGSPGGTTIIGTVLNIIVNIVDFGMPLEEALAAPRILNRDGPTELEAELFANAALKQKLKSKREEVVFKDDFGNAQAVYFDHGKEEIVGASDPRREGESAGY